MVAILALAPWAGWAAQQNDLPFLHTVEGDFEVAWTADIALTDTRLLYRQQKGGIEWDAAFSHASFDVDYRPFLEFDALGFEEHRHEDRFGAQANIRTEVVERFTLLGTAGFYFGYTDYRRVWIANRYRQKYDHPDFERIPNYKDPDPKGWNAQAGARWEYLPREGFAELRVGYARDETAPGYEDGQDSQGDYLLLRGRERLETKHLAALSENVLSERARLLNELNFSKMTAREVRVTYQGSLNLGLGSRWVWRGYGGVSTEAPGFEAHFFGTTLEWEARRGLLLNIGARYYRDTGEIEDSLLTSSAAPPLKSWEVGAGVRYTWGQSALKLHLAAFWTDYEPIASGTAEFTYLYRDRNWGLAQIAYSRQF